jgi:N6-adenosine-specific RNA methylase IME4
MKYRTIVVDPPWHYESWPGSTTSYRGMAARKGWVRDAKVRKPIDYQTLSVSEICALGVQALSETDAHLYLWTTNRYLRDAFDVVTAWGFRYPQTLVWAKTPMGLGPGGAFAQNAEYILFARRGSPGHCRRLDSVWFNWPRQGMNTHSKKPEHFYDMVEQVSPGPYVELFARRHRLGWDVWGNESANTATLVAE